MPKFTSWLCSGILAAGTVAMAADGDVAKGKEVFEQCSVCHNADTAEKKMGPGLKGLFAKSAMSNGKKPTEANVRSKIENGEGGMPPYKDTLTEKEKNDVIAYLKTL